MSETHQGVLVVTVEVQNPDLFAEWVVQLRDDHMRRACGVGALGVEALLFHPEIDQFPHVALHYYFSSPHEAERYNQVIAPRLEEVGGSVFPPFIKVLQRSVGRVVASRESTKVVRRA